MSFLTARDFANLDFYNIYLGLTKQNMSLTPRNFQSLDLYNLYLGAINGATLPNVYGTYENSNNETIPVSVSDDTRITFTTGVVKNGIVLDDNFFSLDVDNSERFGVYKIDINLQIFKSEGTESRLYVKVIKTDDNGGGGGTYTTLMFNAQTIHTNNHIENYSFTTQFKWDSDNDKIFIQLQSNTNPDVSLRSVFIGDDKSARVTFTKISNI